MLECISISPDGEFIDGDGNQIQLRGVNLTFNNKFPQFPYLPTNAPIEDDFWDEAEQVSFVDDSLSSEDIEAHITRLKLLGYNCIRSCFTWEAIEHGGPGVYDKDYMDFTVRVLKIIQKVGGIYVYLDPHQDVWSRFSGGSGAPLWTLYCAGFQPKGFQATEAAILHNYYIDPESKSELFVYPKMIWSTNYFRLACQTMFTLFYGGKDFAPKCIINGVNIQDYLQDKFLKAVMTFYSYIKENAPDLFEENVVIGLETLNEPHFGYLNVLNLDEFSKDRSLKKGTTPTSYQSFLLGEGIACNVDIYDITIFGAKRVGRTLVDPKGVKAWLTESERHELDKKYNWVRDPAWLPGCIWKAHGVWGFDEKHKPVLLNPEYFSKSPRTGEPLSIKYFTNHYFIEFFAKFRKMFREIDDKALLFLEPPVLKEPPFLRGSHLIDNKTVYACHFYDGMSLMFNSWNRKFNIDTFGYMRDRYSHPIFGIVFGETNTRKCFRRQLREMKSEGRAFLGDHVPIFFTEIGMPYNMEEKKGVRTERFTSEVRANDALGFALESNNMSYSLWCYNPNNSHKWGDNWNQENFSIWNSEVAVSEPKKIIFKANGDPSASFSCSTVSTAGSEDKNHEEDAAKIFDYSGFRALDAILRPFPTKIHGKFVNAEFNLEQSRYKLEIQARDDIEGFTTVFLSYYHFPIESSEVKVSSGHVVSDVENQSIRWYHSKGGNQTLQVELKTDEMNSSQIDSTGCTLM
ncbi:HFR073Wp [Eremothecium sinecaudum]|uniref:HFR073Wp n=1 Tax=Eremothecium sinecaudum TaxID=45286 RepID=A0A109V023_9SACH|nr:HFR073Wp [Eremothecium sinecaudum]AMD21928.1 HFR073Wp [Eremothecium sinecaudum]